MDSVLFRYVKLEKMVASIDLDADDKIQELMVIAEESFNLKVYRILKKAVAEIDAVFDRRKDRVLMANVW